MRAYGVGKTAAGLQQLLIAVVIQSLMELTRCGDVQV